MPIHDQSYRHYAGGRAAPGQAWAVIAWAGIRNMIRKRIFLGLLLFAWFPFVVRAVQMYIAANYPQASMLNHEPLRPRKLLLHIGELRKLERATAEKGNALVPLRIYFKGNRAKVEILTPG